MAASVYLVAITTLGTPVDVEAKALAADLGGVPYDHRLKLAAGVPAVVLSTPDLDAARTAAQRIAARGHGVYACSGDDVVAADDMVVLRRFELAPDALVSLDGTGARLPWSDVAALVRATHRTSTETTTTVTEKKFSATRAVMTGGLMINKKTTSTTTTHASDSQAVLYVFGPRGTVPWLIREQQARYDALGDQVTLHSLENFQRTVAELRRRAPGAVFDERLVTRKAAQAADIDVLAHIVARAA
jgi:hypothetical protein